MEKRVCLFDVYLYILKIQLEIILPPPAATCCSSAVSLCSYLHLDHICTARKKKKLINKNNNNNNKKE